MSKNPFGGIARSLLLLGGGALVALALFLRFESVRAPLAPASRTAEPPSPGSASPGPAASHPGPSGPRPNPAPPGSKPRPPAAAAVAAAPVPPALLSECRDFAKTRPEWIFCDDFEDASPLARTGRYLQHEADGGEFAPLAGSGLGGSKGMRAKWQEGEDEAGNLKVTFGALPAASFERGIRPGGHFRDIYYRVYLRMQKGWRGNPYKLSRATVFTGGDWSQAMVGHLWQGGGGRLKLDPASCVDIDGKVVCSGYNDFKALKWLGAVEGRTGVFDSTAAGKWVCIEHRVRLNDVGKKNGLQEFWVDGRLEARKENLDFVCSFGRFGINAVFLENFWNGGAPCEQERYFDHFVISTAPIGCEPEGSTSALGGNTALGLARGAAYPSRLPGSGPAFRTAGRPFLFGVADRRAQFYALDGRIHGFNPTLSPVRKADPPSRR